MEHMHMSEPDFAKNLYQLKGGSGDSTNIASSAPGASSSSDPAATSSSETCLQTYAIAFG